VVQDYCDWCYLPLTDGDRRASIAAGLAPENAWACASCVKQGRVRTPSAGWKGNAAEWPFQSDASARLQPHLRPGERVLWSGGPDPKVWFTRMDLLYVPLSIIICGFQVFLVAITARSHDRGATAYAILVFLPGLYVLFGRFIYKRYRKTRTAYGITPQRALVVVGANVRTKSPLRGQPIWVTRSWNGRHASVEIGGPVGVVTGALAANTGLDSYYFHSDRRRAEVPFAFYDVEHPDAMLNALERAGTTPGSP
jgi:hypothetical protein